MASEESDSAPTDEEVAGGASGRLSASPLVSSPENQRKQIDSTIDSYRSLHDRVIFEGLQNAIDSFFDATGASLAIKNPRVSIIFHTVEDSSKSNRITIKDNGPGMPPETFGRFVHLGSTMKDKNMEPVDDEYAKVRRILKGSQGVGIKSTVFSSCHFHITSVYERPSSTGTELYEWKLTLDRMVKYGGMDDSELMFYFDTADDKFRRGTPGGEEIIGEHKKSESKSTGVTLSYEIDKSIIIPEQGEFTVHKYLDSIVEEHLEWIGSPNYEEKILAAGEVALPNPEIEDNLTKGDKLREVTSEEGFPKFEIVNKEGNPVSDEKYDFENPHDPINLGAFVHDTKAGKAIAPKRSYSQMVEDWFRLSKYTGDMTRTIENARKEESKLFKETNSAILKLKQEEAINTVNAEAGQSEMNNLSTKIIKDAISPGEKHLSTIESMKNEIIDFGNPIKLIIDLSEADYTKSRFYTKEPDEEVESKAVSEEKKEEKEQEPNTPADSQSVNQDTQGKSEEE